MTWTYTGDPAGSSRDAVRFRVFDTDTTDQLLSDEEIAWVLSVQSNVNLAAAQCCEALAAKFARKASFSNGALSVGADRFKQYTDQARTLRAQASADAVHGVSILVGGRKISARETLEADTSVVQPLFRQGQDDNYLVPPNNQVNNQGD